MTRPRPTLSPHLTPPRGRWRWWAVAVAVVILAAAAWRAAGQEAGGEGSHSWIGFLVGLFFGLVGGVVGGWFVRSVREASRLDPIGSRRRRACGRSERERVTALGIDRYGYCSDCWRSSMRRGHATDPTRYRAAVNRSTARRGRSRVSGIPNEEAEVPETSEGWATKEEQDEVAKGSRCARCGCNKFATCHCKGIRRLIGCIEAEAEAARGVYREMRAGIIPSADDFRDMEGAVVERDAAIARLLPKGLR